MVAIADRLFVAVAPPADPLDRLEAELPRLAAAGPEPTWVPRPNWHVTLHFLGEAWQASMAVERLQRLHLPARPTLRMAGSGRFGRAAWLGLEAQGAGAGLAPTVQMIRGALPVEDAPPVHIPHLTVAWTDTNVESALSGYVGPWWQPEEVILFRSTGGRAARFEPIYRIAWR